MLQSINEELLTNPAPHLQISLSHFKFSSAIIGVNPNGSIIS